MFCKKVKRIVDVIASVGSGSIPEGNITLGDAEDDKVEEYDKRHCLGCDCIVIYKWALSFVWGVCDVCHNFQMRACPTFQSENGWFPNKLAIKDSSFPKNLNGRNGN